MRTFVIGTAAIILPFISPAAAHELVTPPMTPRALPQGAPAFVDGYVPHPAITLDYAVVDGRRVLFDPATGRIVYVLHH